MRDTITVFGSGRVKENSRQWKQAYEVGFLLAQTGFNVMNGGYGGSMQASAKGAKEANGKTIGITTDEFRNSKANQFIDREVRVASWHERLYQLIERGDGFVVLDGGTGTLAELAVLWEMKNKNLSQKPIAVLGRRMRSLVRSFKQSPEIMVPSGFQLVLSPKAAVRCLENFLSHV